MDSNGKVVQKHYSKFRQINRFLEIIDDVFPYLAPEKASLSLSKPSISGCGKAYLTFAIYHYLKLMKGLDVEITGLDLKTDVINFCIKSPPTWATAVSAFSAAI